MKKFCLTLMVCLLKVAMVSAEINEYVYGYNAEGVTRQDTMTYGNIKTAVISGFSNSSHSGAHYALLSMTSQVTNTLGGSRITKVAFYPFMTSQSTAKVVISKEIGGTPLYEQEASITSGEWNVVTLDTPFIIPRDSSIYIGYSIESASGDYPIGYYYTSNILAAGTIDPILDYIAYEKNGGIVSGLLDTQMYVARRQLANLMLYAVIENPDGLPCNAVSIGSAKLSSDVYIKPGTSQSVRAYFNNVGVQNLTSYHVSVTHNGESFYDSFISGVNVKPMEESSFSLQLPTSAEGLHRFSITIDQPNRGQNDYTGNTSADFNYLVYTDSVKRNVLLEHFTTGACANCPAGEDKVVSELQSVPSDVSVIRINHHSGYDADKLSTDDDKALEWLYGGSYIWAPANMIDRTDLADYGAKGYGGTATVGPIFGTAKSSSISTLITAAAHLPAFVNLEADASLSGSNQLKVDVDVNSLYDLPNTNLMRLNVVLVEDSVIAPQYLADQSVSKKYVHNDVYRASLTGTWGEAIALDGRQLHRTYTYTVPSGFTLQHMRVVAFLADYDATSTKNCRVYNTCSRSLQDLHGEGIGDIHADAVDKSKLGVFNLAGQRVTQTQKGVYIVNGQKVLY